MTETDIPYLIEPTELESRLPASDLLIVDVGTAENYLRHHVPGAVFLDYRHLTLGRPPAPGLLPPMEQLLATLASIGLEPHRHVIAYDDQGNGRASRLLWTLEVVGHTRASLLNGGLNAWLAEGHVAEERGASPRHGNVAAHFDESVIADREYVLAALGDSGIMLLDARSPEEYLGLKSASPRRGRIPGAVNLNWLDTIDRERNARLKPKHRLETMVRELGLSRDKEIITYCQTHHRSAHSFCMLRYLGFDKIRGYAGSWSEWASEPGLPIE